MEEVKRGRILMLLENNSYPGDTRVRREALALVDAGFSVVIIAPRDPGQPRRETVQGVRVYRYPPPRERDSFLGFAWEFSYSTLAAFWVSFSVLFREGFDAIHAHSPPDTLFFVGLFYKLFGKSFVFDHHDLSPELYMARSDGKGSKLVYAALRFFEWGTFKTANRVIATNESYREIALKRGGVPEGHVVIVRNGPPLNDLGVSHPSPALQSDKIILGYAGTISIQDGLEYLVRALRYLRHELRRSDFICLVMGDGDDLGRIKQMTKEARLTEHIRFTGWLEKDELWRMMASVNIGLDPDPSNSFNDRCTMIKMTEYMAFAMPIVAFDLPEHRYTAKDAAVYVGQNDPVLFAKEIEKLMDDPLRRKKMGAFGRARVENEIAWEYSIPALINVYNDLFGWPVRPDSPEFDVAYSELPDAGSR